MGLWSLESWFDSKSGNTRFSSILEDMNLLLLGGNSIKNRGWIQQIGEDLRPYFEEVLVHQYKHWSSGTEFIDFEAEQIALDSVDKTKEWCVFAKSAGTLLTMMAVKNKKFAPLKSVFVGTAINWGRERGVDVEKLIEAYSIPTFFIQKTSDPACSFLDLKALLENQEFKSVELYEVEGNDHSYDDLKLLENITRRFLLEA